MGPRLLWVVGVGTTAFVLSTGSASAETRIDVGIFTRNIGARVVLGQPRVVVAPPPRVIVVDPYDRGFRARGPGRAYANRYWREREKAERRYQRDLDKAWREYEKQLRKAERHRHRW
jgi:hypothetical protein